MLAFLLGIYASFALIGLTGILNKYKIGKIKKHVFFQVVPKKSISANIHRKDAQIPAYVLYGHFEEIPECIYCSKLYSGQYVNKDEASCPYSEVSSTFLEDIEKLYSFNIYSIEPYSSTWHRIKTIRSLAIKYVNSHPPDLPKWLNEAIRDFP